MSAASKIRQSREAWRQKATDRGNTGRDQRKTIRRQSTRIEAQNRRIREQERRIAELERLAAIPAVVTKVDVVLLALQLFVIGRISLRAVARVLKIVAPLLGGFKPPCPQTVCNWVTKLSLARLWNRPDPVKLVGAKDSFTNGWLFLLDESIGHAAGKMLLVLGVRSDHYLQNTGYPGFDATLPIAVGVSMSWTGENICEWLRTLIGRIGRPAGFIVDGGTNLRKAMELLGEQTLFAPVIRDISHYVANLLSAKYSEDPRLDSFLSTCGECAAKLKQSILACLAPPQVRTKARFMNLHKLIRWAEKILALSPLGRAPSGSMLEKLRLSVLGLPEHKQFIKRFAADAKILLTCQTVLKQKGLSRESKATCRRFIRKLPDRDPIKLGMISWLNDHQKIAKGLGLQDSGLVVASDAIESIFGLSKSHGSGSIKDPGRLAVKIGALCGGISRDDALKVVRMSHASLRIASPVASLQANRVAILGGKKDLESLGTDEEIAQFSILPDSRNRDNSDIIDVISDSYRNTAGPPSASITKLHR